MANTSPFTYQSLINAIQLQTLNDPTPPATSSQEYAIYSQMINNLAIPSWENERGTLWNELWVNKTNYYTISASSATTTIPQSTPLPADFKFMFDGIINVTYPGSTTSAPNIRAFQVKMLPELALNPRNNLPNFYVTGNIVNGFRLQLGWWPQAGAAEIGANISFRYYKYANTLSNPNDVPEMSDPNFIIYKVSAQVNANNYNTQNYQIMEAKANYSLLNMRMANDMSANYQDDYIKDIDALTGFPTRMPTKFNSGFWNGNMFGF